MLDFLLTNIELSLLAFFLLVWLVCLFTIKHEYIHEKVKWWIYIILFISLFFIHPYTLLFSLLLLSWLACFEFYKVLKFWIIKNILIWLLFILFLFGFISFILLSPDLFLYFFIIVSFSDIIAYFVGKNFPWKKWFTSLSPNKSLSWVIAQILFIFIVLYSISFLSQAEWLNTIYLYLLVFFAWILAPIWDLTESYFKRKVWIKDMAEYIPGHGWVLDRIDSIFLTLWWLTLFWIIMVLIKISTNSI